VSTFAIQFAKAAGATVISTTSSKEKAEFLRGMDLPPDYVIDYKSDKNWGEAARALSAGGLGVDQIVEVGGPATLEQSFNAIKYDGLISIIGVLGGAGDARPSFAEVLKHNCVMRGVIVGSRSLFEEMNRMIDEKRIKPVIDPKVWDLDELKEAYQYLVSRILFVLDNRTDSV